MIDKTVPPCPGCLSDAIGIPKARMVVCTNCTFQTRGMTYAEAMDDWSRRNGHNRHEVRCTHCDLATTANYYPIGSRCPRGGCGGSLELAAYSRGAQAGE